MYHLTFLAIFRGRLQTIIPLLIWDVMAYVLTFWAGTHLLFYALVLVTTARWSPITQYVVFYLDQESCISGKWNKKQEKARPSWAQPNSANIWLSKFSCCLAVINRVVLKPDSMTPLNVTNNLLTLGMIQT